MTRYLHTMVRITDPEKSRAFYEALGLEFRRDIDIVRNGEREATNYLFDVPGQEEELELTLNHDGRTYDLGTGPGHVARGEGEVHEGPEMLRLHLRDVRARQSSLEGGTSLRGRPRRSHRSALSLSTLRACMGTSASARVRMCRSAMRSRKRSSRQR